MIELRLTDEQLRAIEKEAGKPVAAVDPATQKRFVLLADEQYERVRPLLETWTWQVPPPPEPPSFVPSTEEPPPFAGLDAAKRVRLDDLPIPPELERDIQALCKRSSWRRREAERQLKMQYYFGGHSVYEVRTPNGPVIIPIPERYRGTEGLDYVLLTPEERSCACSTIPEIWRDQVARI